MNLCHMFSRTFHVAFEKQSFFREASTRHDHLDRGLVALVDHQWHVEIHVADLPWEALDEQAILQACGLRASGQVC